MRRLMTFGFGRKKANWLRTSASKDWCDSANEVLQTYSYVSRGIDDAVGYTDDGLDILVPHKGNNGANGIGSTSDGMSSVGTGSRAQSRGATPGLAAGPQRLSQS